MDGQVTQRSPPPPFFHDRQRMPESGVVGAEHNAAGRNLEPREYCPCNLSGIDVASVRYDAADGGDERLRRGKETPPPRPAPPPRRRVEEAPPPSQPARGHRGLPPPWQGRRESPGCTPTP